MGVYKLSASGGLKTGRSTYTSMLAGNDVFDESSDFLIQEVLLTSTTSSVTFNTSALSEYKHLQLRWVGRDGSNSGDSYIRFNNDSGNNYATHRLVGGGGSVSSSSVVPASTIYVGFMANNNNDSSGIFAAGITDILDFASTTKNKTVRALTGTYGSNVLVGLRSGVWLNTAAITSIEFISGGSGWVSGSRISLYGSKG